MALETTSGWIHGTGRRFKDCAGHFMSSMVLLGSGPQKALMWASLRNSGVATAVGHTAFTRIQYGASSAASVLTRPMIPCFAAAYAVLPKSGTSPAADAVTMMDPPLSVRCGTTVLAGLKTAEGLVS